MDRLAEWVMSRLARLLVRIFFRGIEVEDAERLPATGPVVLVANHTNGLVDGLLLMATLPRYPRFLGKSTLFKIPPLWPFLKIARVIPVYRQIDGASGAQNLSAFATCATILRRGGLVALFPEGISHDQTSLQPLRTGAARIALEAAFEHEVPGIALVAVGLTYDAKARFRSRALIRIGRPVPVDDLAADYGADSHETVRRFTATVADALQAVNPPYESWQQVDQLGRIAQVVVRSAQGTLPQDVALGDQVDVAERLAGAAQDPSAAALFGAYGSYARDLELLGLGDDQVVATYPRAKLRRTLAWSVLRVALALPFALVGAVVHVVPFQLMKQVARRPSNEGIKATVKLLGCFFLFTVVYVLIGVLVGRAFGAWWGALASLAAPACGYAAVRLGERVKRIGGLLEGYRIVSDRQGVMATVAAHRAEVVRTALAVLGTA